MSTEDSVFNFLHFMAVRRGAPDTTLTTYKSILLPFCAYLENKDLDQLTLDDIDNYADYLALQDFKPKTYRNKLAAIRSFIRWLWIKDLTLIKPEQIIIPKITEEHEANFLTKKEVKQLLKQAENVRDKAMLYTLIYTACRVSEFTNLRLEDLHERSILVRRGKGGKPRVVFITKECEKALAEYLDTRDGYKQGYLFPNYLGNQLSRQYVGRKVTYYALKANIKKKVTVHTLRHTGATLLLNGGARVEDTQQILGHRNIRTTMIYLHFTNEDLKKAYDKAMPA